MSKSIVLYSGGLDSTVLLWSLRPNVKAIMFHYGQRHEKELLAAQRICNTNDIEHVYADLSGIRDLIKMGSQTGGTEVPEGHYADENMKQTVVPNRNMIMIAIATGWAVTQSPNNAIDVYAAMHAGDHAIYPDCRPEFVIAMQQAIRIGNAWSRIYFNTPFIDKTKAEIVKIGAAIHAPMDQTWSCYKGGILHCGKCGTCVERKEAFQLAGVADPTEYENA